MQHLQNLAAFLNYVFCQIYPSQCVLCKADCLTANLLCSACWLKVEFITNPVCKKCGSSIDSTWHHDYCLVHKCYYVNHHYNAIISIVNYNDISKKLIGRFKFQKQMILVKLWQCWFTSITQQLNKFKSDFIIPVPMHKEKLKMRGYNQTEFLALILAKICKVQYRQDILHKVKNTRNQRDLSQLERVNNLLNAFSIEPNKKKIIAGKNILLIDDVVTTGATVNECARQLLQFGANEVNVLTIARRQLK